MPRYPPSGSYTHRAIVLNYQRRPLATGVSCNFGRAGAGERDIPGEARPDFGGQLTKLLQAIGPRGRGSGFEVRLEKSGRMWEHVLGMGHSAQRQSATSMGWAPAALAEVGRLLPRYWVSEVAMMGKIFRFTMVFVFSRWRRCFPRAARRHNPITPSSTSRMAAQSPAPSSGPDLSLKFPSFPSLRIRRSATPTR